MQPRYETPPSKRLSCLTALRLLAAFQMIQGHSIDAVLLDAARSGPLYALWSYLRGLTSVGFLVAAGVSMALLAARPQRFAEGRSARIKRASGLIGLGYVLHAPWSLLFGQALTADLLRASQVDVLQCIGVSLLALELLAYCGPLAAARSAFVLGTAALFAPAELARLEVLPVVLRQYLSAADGSLFPLLPWSGYPLVGFALGRWALPEGAATKASRLRRRLFTALLLSAALALVTTRLLGPLLGLRLTKLSWVLGCLLCLDLALRDRPLPRRLEELGSHTLVLYVVHVVLLYGDGIGVQAYLGHALSVPAALAFAGLMLVASAACALSYGALQRALRAAEPGARSAPE